MRVFCINDAGWVQDSLYFFKRIRKTNVVDGPAYGDILTVIGSQWEGKVLCYMFSEWAGSEEGFEASEFIPLSEETVEMELVEQTEYLW